MKAVNIRMPEELWEAAEEEAMRARMSASEFVRTALRIAIDFRRARRGDPYLELLEERMPNDGD